MAIELSIGVSDLIQVMQHLSPQDDHTRRAIAGLLGFAWGQTGAVAEVVESRPSTDERPATRARTSTGEAQPSSAPAHIAEPAPVPQPIDTELIALPPRPLQFPTAALRQVREEQIPFLPFAPLLAPNWTRAILTGALATLDAAGPLHIPRLIELLALGRPILTLPYWPWPTLARGVQVLLDLSEAMLPYRKDQVWLIDRLEKTVGYDKVAVLNFAASPILGAGSGPPDEWQPYRGPAPGVPVLALTDLGCGRPLQRSAAARPADWQQLATNLRKAGCPLIVFTPYPRHRWPPALVGRILIVQWDRTTTVSQIHAVVGKGHKV